jgi:hemerythrin-like metal-binding protein
MARFAWTDDLFTGNALIDGDHRALVGLLDALFLAMDQGKAGEAMAKAMGDLIEYTREHFGREEAEMERIRYVASLAHHSEHAKLLKQIIELKGTLDAGGKINVPAVSSFLREWLREHILTADMKLAAVLKKQAQSA